MNAALAFADCAARHAGAINAYQAAREAALHWNDTTGQVEHHPRNLNRGDLEASGQVERQWR